LFGETRNEVGPWLRGGSATTRGLNDTPDALPLVGGQFGGYFPSGANFALCDGSVRTFSPRTTPQVLYGYSTSAGKDTDPRPE
jgi:prepilin-type processing-associated H-X9-DG protein